MFPHIQIFENYFEFIQKSFLTIGKYFYFINFYDSIDTLLIIRTIARNRIYRNKHNQEAGN